MDEPGVSRPKIAIVGATGTVGSQVAELIGERAFEYAELGLFNSEGDAGSVEVSGQTLPVKPFTSAADLAQTDIAFLAVPRGAAEKIAAARPPSLLIDLSLIDQPVVAIPFVVPGLTTRDRLLEVRARSRRIAVPHPGSQVIASLLQALEVRSGFAGATLMLGAASFGHDVISRLFSESAELMNARLSLEEGESQLAFNVSLPPTESELGQALIAQVGTLVAESPAITMQVVRVPAFHGAGLTLSLPTAQGMSEWPTRLRAAPGILLVESAEVSTFVDAARQEAAIVKMTITAAGATLWAVFDPARLAALTALWIAETVVAT